MPPETTPRPFDAERDGLVLGEGAGTLILGRLGACPRARRDHLCRSCRLRHQQRRLLMSPSPNAATMQIAMELALADADLPPSAIGYVNAHGTGTQHGDIAESQATRNVFRRQVPVSSLKSYMGHTLGACGALEAWMSIEMMRAGWFAPTINLKPSRSVCARIWITSSSAGRELQCEYVMSNNFAFGGINTSLIFRRCA